MKRELSPLNISQFLLDDEILVQIELSVLRKVAAALSILKESNEGFENILKSATDQ
jgi:hypothetical protein